VRTFLTELYHIWISERPSQFAAALAYYSLFSFAPVIYIAITVAGIFIDQLALTERLYLRIEEVMGAELATLVQDSVAALSHTSRQGSWLVSLIGFLALLFAASGLFFQLQYALNTIWNVPPPQKGQTVELIKQRLFSFLIVIGLGLVLILAALSNVIMAWLGSLTETIFGINNTQIVTTALVSLGLITLSYAILYKILPQTKVSWTDVWPGAFVTATLTLLGGLALGFFFKSGQITSAFEAAGSFALLLIGIYYMAQIFLFGAVFIRVYAKNFGSLRSLDQANIQIANRQ
jgi:membrane protein